ncbi:hypothetical protein ACSQ67_006439 [Phaseolus vulgaris]
MLNSKLARVGASIAKHLFTRNCTSLCGVRYVRTGRCHPLQSQRHSFTKLYKGAMMERHKFLSTMTTNNTIEEGSEQKETSMRGLTCVFNLPCYSHGTSWVIYAVEMLLEDVEHYNKLEDPTDEENDMLDLAFGLSETSRLGCQVIAKPELDGIRLAIPAATRNFAVDGFVPKPH